MVTDKLVCEFLDWVEKERLCGINTRNQRLAGLHALFRYLQTEVPDGLLMFQKILHIPAKKGLHQPMNYLIEQGTVLCFTYFYFRTEDRPLF